jgi:hypothetical protein
VAANPQPALVPTQKPRYVSPEELQECLQDPRKAKTIRGPEFIVCLEDGELLYQITPMHLRKVHGIETLAEYRARPCSTGLSRYNPGTALIADSLHDQLSQFRSKPRFVRHLESIRPPIRKVIQNRPSRKGRTSQEYRLNKGESQRGGRTDLWKGDATDSAIARLRLQGLTNKEIAERVGLHSRATVRVRLGKMGFPARQCRFEHGKPITGRAILDLCADFNLTKRDLVKILKTGENSNGSKRGQLPAWLAESIYRQSIHPKVDSPLGIEVADSLIALRRKWIQELCIVDGRRGRKIRDFLKSEIRDLPELRAQLKQSLGELRGERPAEVLGWICERARTGDADSNGDDKSRRRFWTLMFFWPVLEKLIAGKQGLLIYERPTGELVDELLARDYSATPYRVRCAARGELTALEPRTLGQRIRSEGASANHRRSPKQLPHSQSHQGGSTFRR